MNDHINKMEDHEQVKVYYLFKTDTFGNSHFVNRDETWTVKLRESFPSIEEAETYVINMSKRDIVRFCSKPTDMFCREFCFTSDKYMKYRTYFIGKPDICKMKKALEEDGVKVIK
jgi:hypothetical protein